MSCRTGPLGHWASRGHFVACMPCLLVMRSVSGAGYFCLDTVIVATPVDDTLLDGLGFQVLSEGFADERGEFVV